jgi:hypothetical protein
MQANLLNSMEYRQIIKQPSLHAAVSRLFCWSNASKGGYTRYSVNDANASKADEPGVVGRYFSGPRRPKSGGGNAGLMYLIF